MKGFQGRQQEQSALITPYRDIKYDPEEHLEAVSKVLDKYDGWLIKAVRAADITK